jgi:hypothetical protein
MTYKAPLEDAEVGIKKNAMHYAMEKTLEEDGKITHESDDSRLKFAINQFLDNYEAYLRRG